MNDGTEPTRTIRSDGIIVRKTVEDDGSVRLEVDSDRDSPATVRVTDPALESRPDEEVQFDTEYGTEWAIDDGSTFERAFDPDEQRRIRYRIPDADPDSIDAEPELSVTEASVLDDITDRGRSDTLREFVGGDRDSLDPVSDSTDPVSGGDPAEPTAEADPDAQPVADTDTASDTASGDDLAVPSGGVARVLLEELRNDRIDDETAAALRSELGVEASESQEVRLRYLQNEVSDLAAYTDTIESFIDRHGTFDSVVDDVRSDLSALEDRTGRIESTVEERSEAIDRIDDIDDELEKIRSVQSDLESDLGEIREMQADFESRFDSLDETVADINDSLDGLELFKERVSGVFEDLQTGDSNR